MLPEPFESKARELAKVSQWGIGDERVTVCREVVLSGVDDVTAKLIVDQPHFKPSEVLRALESFTEPFSCLDARNRRLIAILK